MAEEGVQHPQVLLESFPNIVGHLLNVEGEGKHHDVEKIRDSLSNKVLSLSLYEMI